MSVFHSGGGIKAVIFIPNACLSTYMFLQHVTIRAAFANREKNHKGLVSGGGSGGGGGRGGGGSKGGGGSGGDDGGGAGQSPNPLQAFCNSSISLRLETHFFRK